MTSSAMLAGGCRPHTMYIHVQRQRLIHHMWENQLIFGAPSKHLPPWGSWGSASGLGPSRTALAQSDGLCTSAAGDREQNNLCLARIHHTSEMQASRTLLGCRLSTSHRCKSASASRRVVVTKSMFEGGAAKTVSCVCQFLPLPELGGRTRRRGVETARTQRGVGVSDKAACTKYGIITLQM